MSGGGRLVSAETKRVVGKENSWWVGGAADG